MRLLIDIEGSLDQILRSEVQAAERAVSTAVATAGAGIKEDWRQQVVGVGLGQRLANSIRQQVYPGHKYSVNAAAMVWSKAPQILDSFERGAVIRAKKGFWLAIPLPASGIKRGNRRAETPAEWQFRTGRLLRFVPTGPGRALLVADDMRMNTRGIAARSRRKVRADGIKTGQVSVPIFALFRQTKMPKKLNLFSGVDAAANRFAGQIVRNWK